MRKSASSRHAPFRTEYWRGVLQAGLAQTRKRRAATIRPMALGEFELIDRYFRRPVRRAALGVGDDCALLNIRPGMQLAVSTDLLVEGRHFLSTVDPARLGHKALAVNLSDLAACGAEPLAFTLSLSMPRPDERFLAPFAEGLLALADRHGIELVGGDTTAGPLTLGITVMGEVPPGQALRRSGARAGDVLWVSGFPGEARLALEVFRGTLSLPEDDFQAARRAMELPEPRVALGLALRGLATAAIDVSDGLLGDLGHVLRASGVGAVLHLADFPRRPLLARQPLAVQRMALLTGGDDYELLFTAPEAAGPAVQAAAAQAGVPVQAIGRITATPGLQALDEAGAPLDLAGWAAFDHFKS